MAEREPYDGQPYYCVACGCGLSEYMACEETYCRLETERAAQARRRRREVQAIKNAVKERHAHRVDR